MKRLLLLVLCAMLLCGCETAPASETNATQTVPATVESATEPTGYYDPDSMLEAATQGAVRSYPLNRSDCFGMEDMGGDLLIFSGLEVTTLTKLTGNNLYVSAVANLSCAIYPEDPSVQVSEKGVTYYDEARNELVFLDANLKEVSRVALPPEITGHPALSADRKTLYYFTSDSLRAIDLETGLDRLLREIFFDYQSLEGLHCNDNVLECSVEDSYGNWYRLFLSTETGEMLYESFTELRVWTAGNTYFALHYDGNYEEMLTGTAGQDPSLLCFNSLEYYPQPVIEMGGAVLVSMQEDGMDTVLNFVDLTSGLRTSALTLPGAYYPSCLHGSTEDNCIWFLYYDEDRESDAICRWDLNATPVEDETVYLGKRHDYVDPDLPGLAACAETAGALSEKYGVEVLLWTDAVQFQPWDYWLSAEYQVPLIEYGLRLLDNTLSCYPEGFLKEAAASTANGKLRICLVRGITGNPDVEVLSTASGLQYWDDNNNAYIALTLDSGLNQNFFHELSHIIDNRVLGLCTAYDNWNSLNPEGFEYDYDYVLNLQREDSALTEGEDRAFIDTYSMSYPKEDRARIMEYAMMPGNEFYFESETMQQKLRQLGLGIREAFGLEKSAEVFLWEQYLTEPLASKK